jgi:hypothetical protein
MLMSCFFYIVISELTLLSLISDLSLGEEPIPLQSEVNYHVSNLTTILMFCLSQIYSSNGTVLGVVGVLV